MRTLQVKRGDTYQTIEDVLKVNGVAFDLTGGTVTLVLRDRADAENILEKSATIEDAAAGTVRYRLESDVTLVAGSWLMEWEVAIDGRSLTVPSSEYHILSVGNDLNP